MEITFLGTSGMQPTKDRNLFSILLSHKTENILIDCGEGTQRQFRFVGISPIKITKILITHLHGDHINGLPGLLQNLHKNEYNKTLEIYGPKEVKNLIKIVLLIANLGNNKLKINVNEIKQGRFLNTKEFYLTAMQLDHSCNCYGYSFQETDKRKIDLKYLKKFKLKKHVLLGNLQKGKDIIYNNKKIKAKDATYIQKGKKITLIADTVYCKQAIDLAKDSDLLICESTYSKEEKNKAKEYKHLTSEDAANIAKLSQSKKLILTHFSQRYKDANVLLKEAKKIFKDTEVAKDFMKICV